jgi:hypothetical protein
MIEITKFNREAFKTLVSNPVTAHLAHLAADETTMDSLEKNSYSRTVYINGKPVLVGGIVLHHSKRGEAWAFIDQDCKEHFLALHKVVKKYLGGTRLRRIEAVVHNDYPQGHRWVRALGFTREAENLRSFTSEGKSVSMYSIIPEVTNGG